MNDRDHHTHSASTSITNASALLYPCEEEMPYLETFELLELMLEGERENYVVEEYFRRHRLDARMMMLTATTAAVCEDTMFLSLMRDKPVQWKIELSFDPNVFFPFSGPSIVVAQADVLVFGAYDRQFEFPEEALREYSPDTAVYAGLYRNGKLTNTRLSNRKELVVLDRVEVSQDWRGRGLGPLMAVSAVNRVRGNASLAACFPYPYEIASDRLAEIDAEQERLVKLWTNCGFKPKARGIQTMNLDGSAMFLSKLYADSHFVAKNRHLPELEGE